METIKNAFAKLQAWVTGSPYWATLVIVILAGLFIGAALAKETTITIPRTSDGLSVQQIITPDPECMTPEAMIDLNDSQAKQIGLGLTVAMADGEDGRGVFDLINAISPAPFPREQVDGAIWAENDAAEWIKVFFVGKDGCIFQSFTVLTNHPLYDVLKKLPVTRAGIGKQETF